MIQKRAMAKFLADRGLVYKTNDIKDIEVIAVKNSGNSAGTKLYTYRVTLEDKVVIVGESLLPNRYGATAFSTDCELCLLLTEPLVGSGEDNKTDEQVESEDV